MKYFFAECMILLKYITGVLFAVYFGTCTFNNFQCIIISPDVDSAFFGAGIALVIGAMFSHMIVVVYGDSKIKEKPNSGKIVVVLSLQLLAFICLFIAGILESNQKIGFICDGASIAFFVTYFFSLVELWSILPKETPKKINHDINSIQATKNDHSGAAILFKYWFWFLFIFPKNRFVLPKIENSQIVIQSDIL